MNRILFFLLAGGPGERMRPITEHCPKPLLRFGPSGRIIDFSLYNCLAGGLGDLVVITQHLAEMVELYLSVQWRGAFSARGKKLEALRLKKAMKREYLGTADALYHALMMSGDMPEHIVVLSGNHVYRMDYGPMIDFHIAHGGTATLATFACEPASTPPGSRLVSRSDDHMIKGCVTAHAVQARGGNGAALLSADVHVFSTDKLFRYLELNQRAESYDLDLDILPRLAADGEAWAYQLGETDGSRGYFRAITDLYSFWFTQVELLEARMNDLHFDALTGQIRPPTSRFNLVHEYVSGQKRLINSMISNLEQVRAARVENSVIGPGAIIEDGAAVTRSVIMEGAVIKKGVKIDSALVEPHVEVKQGTGISPGDAADSRIRLAIGGLHQMSSPDFFTSRDAPLKTSKRA